jgi:putative hydrolase of the HAD superfamily
VPGRSARIELVALDAVGTLIDPHEPVGDTYARIARAHGVDVPAWRLQDAFQRVLRAAPPMVFPAAPAARRPQLERAWWHDLVRAVFRAADQMQAFPDFEACFEALFRHFARPEAWRARPGATAALAALAAAGRRRAIASNFDHRLHALLAGLELDGVDAVLLPSDLGAAKPDPRFFSAVAAHFAVDASAAVYVGDDPEQDLAAALRAGWRAIDSGSLATLAELPRRIAALEAEEPRAR